MLTGDNKNSAQNIANIVGIDDIHPSLLPEDKMNIIKNLEDSKSPTCMIGDGVNDALALKYSSVGISMGSIGSDIAIEASDIALASDDIKNIPYLLYLSKKTMKTIKLNIHIFACFKLFSNNFSYYWYIKSSSWCLSS